MKQKELINFLTFIMTEYTDSYDHLKICDDEPDKQTVVDKFLSKGLADLSTDPTSEQIEANYQKVITRLRKDPKWEL
ncbi:MAG: hypothetical protein ACOH2V_00605 [Candidatus Saccharimonadaceae bacterium]